MFGFQTSVGDVLYSTSPDSPTLVYIVLLITAALLGPVLPRSRRVEATSRLGAVRGYCRTDFYRGVAEITCTFVHMEDELLAESGRLLGQVREGAGAASAA